MEFAGAAVKADYGKDSTKKSNIKNVRRKCKILHF